MPPRSHLYSLKPMKIGTPYVESLTSYITRLAQAHSVPTWKLILYEIFSFSSPSLNFFNERSSASINGTGITASKWVAILEKLTLQNELRFLTLLSWANVLSTHKLLRDYLAWCPLCYKEWKETGQEVYQPLLWTIQVIVQCPLHLIPLHFKCPNKNCQKEQFILEKKSRPGHCSYCGQWLGVLSKQETILKDNDIVWQNWVISVVGELLANAPGLTVLPEKKVIADTISNFANLMNVDVNTLTHEIGVSIVSIRSWINGKMPPQFELLLRICYYFNSSPLQFFTGISLVEHSGKVNPPIWDKTLKKHRNVVDREKIKQKMEEILKNEDPPVPFNDLPKRFGCSKSVLFYYFPELCHAISTKYKDYRKKCRIQKEQKLCEEVQSIAKQIHTEGSYPSMYQIQKRSSVSGLFRYSGTLDVWRTVLKELGWENQEFCRES